MTESGKPATDNYPRMTMISVDSGLDGLTGTFAVDEAGNWIGRDGEIVKYAGEDMDTAVARMRKRAGQSLSRQRR